MRFFTALSALSAVAITADRTPLNQGADPSTPAHASEVFLVEPNENYLVKLECPGCPFAVESSSGVSWQHPPQDNVLVRSPLHIKTTMKLTSPQILIFTIGRSGHILYLNERPILPLGPMPLFLKGLQVPANVTWDDMTQLWQQPSMLGGHLPLQYEHTVLRTEDPGQLVFQFDVTGLPSQDTNDTHYRTLDAAPMMRLEGEHRKLVQLVMREDKNTHKMLIDDIKVVARKDRALPYRMKCGSLAMEQTAFNPMEWDEYGKIGTSVRSLKLVLSKIGEFGFKYLQHSSLVLPVALLLVLGLVMFQCRIWQRQQKMDSFDDDAEDALLGSEFKDAPPAYADIPVIKIEEYE
jgi:hypothetical protein